ncbi:hypothetical protein B9Z55_022847 [Caenorhabditis nigoni]|uniref:Galectin n=1 Tax=Caenorhabditis nigoni TaxID=1611254 RepID=A0A2G5SMI3_9PELO|nr:hypothetical protein B9Z55_022847 [Caenorhabditis nigoni]
MNHPPCKDKNGSRRTIALMTHPMPSIRIWKERIFVEERDGKRRTQYSEALLRSMHVITSPDVPSAHAIREQLRAGTEIHVTGHVTHHHHKDFSVELLSGPHIVLHVNFRFEHGHRVAMNTSVNGQWGSEIDHHNPLKHHDHFDLKIHVHEGYYHISVNGEHLADFPHRLPYQSVQAVD